MYALTSPRAKPVHVLKYKCSNTAAEVVFTVGHLQQECFSFPVQSLLVYIICLQKDPLVHVRVSWITETLKSKIIPHALQDQMNVYSGFE